MVAGEIATPIDVMVLGGGPGGYTAAARLVELGFSVVLVERGDLGGVCLNEGCIPSKALISVAHDTQRAYERAGVRLPVDWPGTQQWKAKVVSQLVGGVSQLLNRVTVVHGTGRLLDNDRVAVEAEDHVEHYRYQHCILATGSRPTTMTTLPVDADASLVVDSTGALAFESVPERLVVVGGGYIGTELGMAYARLGSTVHIVEAADHILAGFDADLVKVVETRARELGITIHVNATVAEVSPGHDGVVLVDGTVLRADKVLVSVGRVPNTDDLQLEDAGLSAGPRGLIAVDSQCRTANPKIFAIGDITIGPALAHKASAQARVAAEAIAGQASGFDQLVPLVAFTDPELASVGLGEVEARTVGHDVVVGKARFAHSGRALTLGETSGLVKVVADRSTGVIVGVHIAGPGASELIGEATLMLEMGARIDDVAATIHPHPTLSESLHDAVLAARRAIERKPT